MNFIIIIIIVIVAIIALFIFTDVGGDLLNPILYGKKYMEITKGIKTGQHAPYDMWTMKYYDHISKKIETQYYYSITDLQNGLLARYSGAYSGRITDTQYSRGLSMIQKWL